MEDILELAEHYADEILESSDFKRLLELKKQIQEKCGQKVIAFKTAEAKYLEAKQYGNYHPDLKKYQLNFVEAKQKLYSDPLVSEYKELEQKLQNKLNQDLNTLKQDISNKFKLNF